MADRPAAVYPVKVARWDAQMRCNVISVVGFRARCECGWRSANHKNVAVARTALQNHRLDHEPAAEPETAPAP